MTKRGMMDQFFDIKEQHPDTILFFRMGDFTNSFTRMQKWPPKCWGFR